jgi:ubiquinone/menaquinone biosynthesis C-methylase UbiE
VLGEPPERFVPEEMGGTLLAAEHLVRYWWAAAAAVGADVLDAACGVGFGTALLAGAGARTATGVDLSEEAVAAARERCGSDASFVVADVAELPLEDDSFDLAVCFETIEHVSRPERAIAELRRVLRPSGTLVISSPNRGVSPPGNPHHAHELTPAELRDELARAFAHVELFGQQSWFASALVNAGDRDGEADQELNVAVRTDEPVGPGDETYTVAVAGDGPTPAALGRGAVFLSSPRAPGALHDEIRAGQRRAHLEGARAGRAEAEAERLARELTTAREALASITSSPSWRLTAPLRSAERALARRR